MSKPHLSLRRYLDKLKQLATVMEGYNVAGDVSAIDMLVRRLLGGIDLLSCGDQSRAEVLDFLRTQEPLQVASGLTDARASNLKILKMIELANGVGPTAVPATARAIVSGKKPWMPLRDQPDDYLRGCSK